MSPTKRLDDVFVLELWHGPTFAFKDVALQFLGNLFEYFLKRKNAKLQEEKGRELKQEEKHKLTVVGATSGDTGRSELRLLLDRRSVRELSFISTVPPYMGSEARRTCQYSYYIRKEGSRRSRRLR